MKIRPSKPFLTLVGMLIATACSAAIGVKDLRCEYLVNPLGLDAASPRLSWVVTADRRAEAQTAYRILVASSPSLLKDGAADVWDSGKVASDETTQIEYGGKPLVSRERCYWKVRAWDRDGKPGRWSESAWWEMGLLTPGEWSAKWIGSDVKPGGRLTIRQAIYGAFVENRTADVTAQLAGKIQDNHLRIDVRSSELGADPAPQQPKHLRVEYEYDGQTYVKEVEENQPLELPGPGPVPYLRKAFEAPGAIRQARLYVTALGLYDLRLNGRPVGDHVLAPDWTDYRKRVRYQVYDVTSLLHGGANALGAKLGGGWFSGHIGNGGFQYFGKQPAFLAQLEITGADGQVETIVSDASWKWHESAIQSSDFMQGEDFDARREIQGWDEPGLDERQWQPVAIRSEGNREFDAQVMEPVRELAELKPLKVSEPEPGHWVYDLGQNMVGVARLKVSAAAGTRITLRHAEMLNPDGTIYITNLRGAPSVDHYVCRGGGTEVWQPRFTFHGFRYVEITGLTGKPNTGVVTGVVIGSDNPRTGTFVCSDPRINQLQSNIQWGQRGNYVSVPTDCPQRDERLGWMGDAEVFVRTATYNADVASFFTKWLVDVDDGQTASGSFADVSPNTMGANGVPAWGDAGVICPWTIYEVYGDKRILERHLPAMTRWVNYLEQHSDGLIRDRDRGNDYGDWLSIGADTPKDLIGTAFFAYSTHLVANSYRALGRTAEADKYEQLFERIKTAFDQRYLAADGRLKGDTQCDYAMALKFGLLPAEMRPRAARYLQADIQAKGGHLSTGFVGVSYLLPVLTEAGAEDTAYELLRQDTFPSWLFSVKHGATTIWERWDGWTPEKGFQDPGMNSFNHYSLGSCGEYLFGGIGGIRPASPGFKTIQIRPAIHAGLDWAKTRFDSIHGTIATDWKREGKRVELTLVVPANTTATVWLPATDVSTVTESGRPASQAEGVKFLQAADGLASFEVGSGTYKFAAESDRPYRRSELTTDH
jgi:alpha-L-rhamnosidase